MTNLRAMIWAVLGIAIATTGTAQAIVPLPRPSRPPAPTGWTYEWVPPVYRTVTDRAWVPGTTQWVRNWVEVAPGCWQETWQPVQTPGRWEWTARQVLVSPGYWRLVKLDGPPVPPIPLPRPQIGPAGPTVGVEGYPQAGGEDMSRFSGLSEWPK